MTRPTVPDRTRVGRTALTVADLAETTDFYRDVVGLAVQSRDDESATLGVDGTPLLVLSESDVPDRDPESAGLYHNAFRVPSRGALGDALRRVRNRWRLDGASDHLVSEALYLTDPEDNGVEIYRDRPREEWEFGDDGTVRMDTLPLDVDALVADASGTPDAGAPPGTAVGHVHLEVSSLARSREFYVDTLGLGVRAAYGDSALFVAAGEYHHHLGLNTWRRRSRPAAGRGLAWFELVVPDEDALAAVRRRLADAGESVTDRDDGVAVTDPDGVSVRLRVDSN
ncbi:VOC family protein [Halorussus sp. MSC15.2]|uniref:VOC family protein n=1 Tax=Halorussus sp. MSC15.2 TaxID=2283638 RepID=UPI0013D125AA|nr:VOC family protein [Halorussus sp. MSC15.2]NEU56153.1 VOC family protein [Halorussus sp. MSC15.2]